MSITIDLPSCKLLFHLKCDKVVIISTVTHHCVSMPTTDFKKLVIAEAKRRDPNFKHPDEKAT